MNHNHWPQELSKGRFHVHFFQWKKTFHNRGPKNKFIIEDQVPSWSTTLKICLGAMFYKGFNWGIGGFGQLSVLKKPRESYIS